jgi:rubrerythrin
MAVFGLGSTSQNLQGGINGETFEITEMYPTYIEMAKFQGEKGAELSFHYALE